MPYAWLGSFLELLLNTANIRKLTCVLIKIIKQCARTSQFIDHLLVRERSLSQYPKKVYMCPVSPFFVQLVWLKLKAKLIEPLRIGNLWFIILFNQPDWKKLAPWSLTSIFKQSKVLGNVIKWESFIPGKKCGNYYYRFTFLEFKCTQKNYP